MNKDYGLTKAYPGFSHATKIESFATIGNSS